ncbi:TRAP transporter large permease subunit [Desulfovibrio sp. OttesenSCG-928-F07]|nr:TRAP transporter large permease subunit [Desulfovibrio sp. OttesenSCG-928-F07]
MTATTEFSCPAIDKPLAAIEKLLLKARYLGMLSMVIIPIVITTDVICRFFGIAVPGALEMQENLLVLNTFAIIALIQVRNEHMGIDLIYERMPRPMQRWADVTVSALTIAVLFVLTRESIVSFMKKSGTLSFELFVPLEVYYWMPVFGLSLALLVALPQFIRYVAQCMAEKQFIPMLFGFASAAFILYLPFLYRNSDFELTGLALGGIAFLFMFFLLFIKMPIGWAMCLIGGLGMIAVARNIPAALATVGTTSYTAVATYNFIAMPMFVLMGSLILFSGISQDLFDCAARWIGHLPGGMGMASVAGCTGFAAVSGDSMSTAVTMGAVALPEMKRLNYNDSLATGAIAAGGTLGILIPPSGGFIIYGIVTEVSVGRLFMAGIVPGVMLAVLFMIYIYILAKTKPEMAPSGPKYGMAERFASLSGILPMLALFILVLGGIVMGLFSPNEGGAIGAVGAFFFALAKRKLTVANLKESLIQAGVLTSRLMCIMIGVGVLGYFFAATRLPFVLADWITSLPFSKYVIFGIIILIYIVLGCMMNVIPMLMLTLPSIFPTVLALGFDPVWFGVVSVMVMEMGQITPPVGVVVFALSGVARDVPMEDIFKGVFPFVGLIIVGVILVTAFPELATWLPYSMMGPEIM